MNKTPELLPCPFCGGEAKLVKSKAKVNDYRIKCNRCHIKTGWWMGEIDELIEQWNTRVYPPEVIEDYFRKQLSVNCKCGTPIIANKKTCPKCGRDWSDYE